MTATLERSHAARPAPPRHHSGPSPTPGLRPAGPPRTPERRDSKVWHWAAIVVLLAVVALAGILLSGDGASPRNRAPNTVQPPIVTVTTIRAASDDAHRSCAPPIPSWWPCPTPTSNLAEEGDGGSG